MRLSGRIIHKYVCKGVVTLSVAVGETKNNGVYNCVYGLEHDGSHNNVDVAPPIINAI